MNHIIKWLAGCLVGLPACAVAETFENAYISFDLPDGWECQQEGTEFVCHAPSPSGKDRPAIMIMTAKEPGPEDTLAAYMEHLSKVPPGTNSSLFKTPTQVNVDGTLWIDATWFSSEVLNYYTRYMATVKDNLAVLYTFSVHKSHYQDFAGVSTLAVQTLQVKPQATRH
ncbi:hypothetical protein ABE485_07100 [Achromobacter spanius]|uniref:hypothetical protein n=1 Tax=Achromobacter spanius TaxID=217203 RepID=UPI0032098E50